MTVIPFLSAGQPASPGPAAELRETINDFSFQQRESVKLASRRRTYPTHIPDAHRLLTYPTHTDSHNQENTAGRYEVPVVLFSYEQACPDLQNGGSQTVKTECYSGFNIRHFSPFLSTRSGVAYYRAVSCDNQYCQYSTIVIVRLVQHRTSLKNSYAHITRNCSTHGKAVKRPAVRCFVIRVFFSRHNDQPTRQVIDVFYITNKTNCTSHAPVTLHEKEFPPRQWRVHSFLFRFIVQKYLMACALHHPADALGSCHT